MSDLIQCQLKLRPTKAQDRTMRRWLWNLTAVWNWAIRKIELDAKASVYHSEFTMKGFLSGHSKRLGISSSALGGTVATAHTAWDRCFRGFARKPKLKGKRRRLSSIAFDHWGSAPKGRRIRIPCLGSMKFHAQDIPSGRISSARVVKRASGWYLCLFIRACPLAVPVRADGQVGIDPGFSNLLTFSTGETIDHPREWERRARRLGQAQRGNRAPLVARLQERIGNQRKHRNHHLSRRLVAENRLIAFSADKHAVIARRFGRSVSSSGHYQLRSMLAYKSRAGGREYIEVPSRNSTRTCSSCGALTGPTGWAGLKVRQWDCGACGAHHDRDCNAAVNTLIAGLEMSHKSRREAAYGIAS